MNEEKLERFVVEVSGCQRGQVIYPATPHFIFIRRSWLIAHKEVTTFRTNPIQLCFKKTLCRTTRGGKTSKTNIYPCLLGRILAKKWVISAPESASELRKLDTHVTHTKA
jgi:hypothetical protein